MIQLKEELNNYLYMKNQEEHNIIISKLSNKIKSEDNSREIDKKYENYKV